MTDSVSPSPLQFGATTRDMLPRDTPNRVPARDHSREHALGDHVRVESRASPEFEVA